MGAACCASARVRIMDSNFRAGISATNVIETAARVLTSRQVHRVNVKGITGTVVCVRARASSFVLQKRRRKNETERRRRLKRVSLPCTNTFLLVTKTTSMTYTEKSTHTSLVRQTNNILHSSAN